MPWKEENLMSLKKEFILFAMKEGSNISALCRRFGVSRKTAYKWLKRFRKEWDGGLVELSRVPHSSPYRTSLEMEQLILGVRDEHTAWGGRKLHTLLTDRGHTPPAASTITQILRRNGRIDEVEAEKHRPCHRFERDSPNELWQMDFKGDFPLARGGRCHPLTVIDDHSRYAVCLTACTNQRTCTVKACLISTFRTYGLPERMLMDNGSCWGPHSDAGVHTHLTAWLIRIGIAISHGRIYHPQTQGKNERFNRTLKAEVISAHAIMDIAHCQELFNDWRPVYNLQRPHEGIGMKPPGNRYRPSAREYPESLSPIEYAPDDIVRKVYTNATISYKRKVFRIGKAFVGQPLALRPTSKDGILEVFYCHARIATIDMHQGKCIRPETDAVTQLSEQHTGDTLAQQ